MADPAALAGTAHAETEQEKARRERVREQAAGIVAFACDATHSLAAFTLAGQVYVAGLAEGGRSAAPDPGAPRRVRPAAGSRPASGWRTCPTARSAW